MNTEVDYVRYLNAKEPIDKRSINTYVFNTFIKHIKSVLKTNRSIGILDVGAGLGSSFKRIHESVGHGHIDYTVVDIEEAHVKTAQAEITQWLRGNGYSIQEESAEGIRIKEDSRSVHCHFVTADALTLASESAQVFDAVVGQAFLDIIPLESGLTALFKSLKPDGAFYFPINFDGISALLPVVDRARDTLVEEIFHRSMDERKDGRTGGSQTGRQLLEVLPAVGARIDAVGASDWIVRPTLNADSYPDDEEYFLKSILKFMHNELKESEQITSEEIAVWYEQRRSQLHEGELKYIAHQLDYAGQYVGI